MGAPLAQACTSEAALTLSDPPHAAQLQKALIRACCFLCFLFLLFAFCCRNFAGTRPSRLSGGRARGKRGAGGRGATAAAQRRNGLLVIFVRAARMLPECYQTIILLTPDKNYQQFGIVGNCCPGSKIIIVRGARMLPECCQTCCQNVAGQNLPTIRNCW